MKRMSLVLVVLAGIMTVLYARDFEPSWVERMSNYIGKKTDAVPHNFVAVDNGYAYVDKSKSGGFLGIGARDVVEIIFANQNKVVEYAFWYMDSWLGSDEKKELEDIQKDLTSKYGSPKTENSGYIWNWKKSGGFLGLGANEYEIYLYRDSSDNSACVLIQKKQSGFETRWRRLLGVFGIGN
jgi:hypothetical protein